MNLVMRSLIIVALALLAAACTKGTEDLRQWVSEVRQRPAEPIDPIPPIQTPEVVAYEAEGLRDPFRGVGGREDDEEQVAGESGGLRPDPDRRKEYLEQYPLDTLSMVGTIEMGDVEYALIRDNDNVVHRVREGNYMGQNHGLVTAVEPNQVEVRELVQDGRGGWVERRVRVAMAED